MSKDTTDKDNQDTLKIYKIYLEGIEKISDRRGVAIQHFITLNSALLLGVGFLIRYLSDTDYTEVILFVISFVGLMLSVIFYILINSYKQLNSGKFKVLHDIEKRLSISPYKDEWRYLGKGKDKRKYFPFSHVEKYIFIIFGSVYLVGTMYFLYILICS